MACVYYFSRMNIIFNSLLAQLVQYDVHTTRKIKHTPFLSLFYSLLHEISVGHWEYVANFAFVIDY